MGKNNVGKKERMPAKPVNQELLPPEGRQVDYSHLPINEQAAFRCKDRIEGAAKSASTAFYDMAMGLLEAYENDYAKIWGYDNFSEYVEKSLDMKYRSAYYMVEIGKVSRKFGIDRAQVEKIGWTKMREIASFIQEKPEDSARYLEMAESMSAAQLREALGAEVRMSDSREAAPAVMRLSLKLEGDSANLVSDGLAMAYGDIGKEDTGLALQHIVGEWLIARGATPTAASLEDWLAYLKKVYGVTLVRAEESDSIDSLLVGGVADAAAEDKALEELLSSTEDELDSLLK